jgi:serine phosphatase RsbU (regulator of sigma subunit)
MSADLNNIVSTSEEPTSISILEDCLAEQANRFSEISRVGTVVASLLDLNRVLAVVMESALAMTKGEVGQIALFNDDTEVEPSICWGISPKVAALIKNKSGLCLWEQVRQSGESIKVDNLRTDQEWKLGSVEVNITGFLVVPFKAQEHLVGAVIVANKIEAPQFDDNDLYSLEMLGCFAAVAIQNSVLHAQALAKQKMDAELEMARQIQRTLMPQRIVEFDSLSVMTHIKMALQVGGDFFDIIEISPGKYVLVVADVSSKGMPAALLMTSTRSLIRAYAEEPLDLVGLVKSVNYQLSRDSAELKGMFVTLILVYNDFQAKIIRTLNAGHPPGFLRYPDGTITEIKVGGPFIGQFENFEFREQALPLVPGTRLFLYTDGAFECFDKKGQMFGLAGLRHFFAQNCGLPSQEFIEKMLLILEKYSSDKAGMDDITLLLADLRQP